MRAGRDGEVERNRALPVVQDHDRGSAPDGVVTRKHSPARDICAAGRAKKRGADGLVVRKCRCCRCPAHVPACGVAMAAGDDWVSEFC